MKTVFAAARLSVLPLAWAAAFPSWAQTPLQEVVVTATRVAQPVSDLVADVTIIDSDAIQRSGAASVADVLARVPGIEISRTGGPGANTSVFLRGAETRFTAVYLDGVRIDSQATGGASWNTIPLAQIDRIEVLRGPASAVYGSDALGGVIQLFTKRGEGGVAPFVGVGLGTYGTRKLNAGVSGASGGLDYSLGFAGERSNGFNSLLVAGANPDDDGYRSQSGNARVGLQIQPGQRLEATALASKMNAQYDDQFGSPTTDDHATSKLRALGLNWSAKWSDVYSTQLAVTDSRDTYATRPSVYDTETRLRGYLFQNEFHFGTHRVTAALERKQDHLVNDPIDSGRHEDALALGYGWQQQAHTLQLNVRHDKDSEFGGHNTGSVAYGYAFTPQWRGTASAGTAFRAPTLYQRFSEYGAASLQPETSHNTELGLRYAAGPDSLGLVAYRNTFSNLISFVGAGPCASPYGCYANTARAQSQGVTVSGGTRLGPVNLQASADFQNPRDLDNGQQLARRARRHATLGADTTLAGWTVGGALQFSSKRFEYDYLGNATVLGGYTLVGLNASTHLAPEWTLLARVDNLANKTYQTANTYASAGRSVYVGVSWAAR
ncbi:MAG: TonB-dependent receptor [Rhodoferax sp.]|uniref:TonB-dependent receptor domain-containing protein n=1 Tax=Rhodoferax sp. TaxID=50421 RepID=UPI0032667F26